MDQHVFNDNEKIKNPWAHTQVEMRNVYILMYKMKNCRKPKTVGPMK